VRAVQCCLQNVKFFEFLKKLYTLFSSSTHTWNLLCTGLKPNENNRLLVLKSLNGTRWSSQAESCNALLLNFQTIMKILEEISKNEEERTDTRRDANTLHRKMMKYELHVMAVLWHRILTRFNETSKYLQEPDLDIVTAVNLMKSLETFISSQGDKFDKLEEVLQIYAENIANGNDAPERSKTKRFLDGNDDIYLTPRQKFQVETFTVIIDTLLVEIKRRIAAYEHVCSIFHFIPKLGTEILNEEDVKQFIEVYKEDVESENIKEKITHFSSYMMTTQLEAQDKNAQGIYRHMYNNDLQSVFPNMFIALRLYLTLPISSCKAERAFSKLLLIKNPLRTALKEDKLNALTILSSEQDIIREMDFSEKISNFAALKARKKQFSV